MSTQIYILAMFFLAAGRSEIPRKVLLKGAFEDLADNAVSLLVFDKPS